MAGEKKPGFVSRIGRYFREMRSELKKVVWPTRKQVVNNSIIVLVCVVFMGALTFAFDSVMGTAVRSLISLFQG